MSAPKKIVAIFLGLLVVIRGPFYWLGLSNDWGNSRNVPYWVLPLTVIASPLAFALAARWSVQRNMRGFGFKPGPIGWLLVGWLMPVIVAVAAYGTAAAFGFVRLKTDVDLDLLSFAGRGALFTLALIVPTLLFEEIGWRGVLVPELAKFLTFGWVALITGVIWALFHYPWMLSPIYTRVPPTFASITTFTIGIMAASVALAWITLVSRSLWPAVLFHSCHNAFVAGVLERSLKATEPAYRAFIGVSGYSMALGYCILALICWRLRHLITARSEPGSDREG